MKALKAFNSAQAIMVKSGDTSRMEFSERMIKELEMIPGVLNNLDAKFDTDFLNENQKTEFEK